MSNKKKFFNTNDPENQWLDNTWYTYSSDTDSYEPYNREEQTYCKPGTSKNYEVHSHYSLNDDLDVESPINLVKEKTNVKQGEVESILEPNTLEDTDIKKESSDEESNLFYYDDLQNEDNNDAYSNNKDAEFWDKACWYKPDDAGTSEVSETKVKLENIENNSTNFVCVFLPESEVESISEALVLLTIQNEGLNTELWYVISEETKKDGRSVVFTMDQTSSATLQANSMKASMGFRKLTFTLYSDS